MIYKLEKYKVYKLDEVKNAMMELNGSGKLSGLLNQLIMLTHEHIKVSVVKEESPGKSWLKTLMLR